MKVILHYEDHENSSSHKTLKITLPKSWKTGPTSKLLNQFVESYNASKNALESSNSLIGENMHLELDSEGKMVFLANDAVVIEYIPDRADVYVCHGASKSLSEIQKEIEEEKAKKKKACENMVQCAHFGCRNRFPKGGPYPTNCVYHAKPPVFHETAKFWSCCPDKKAYDWETFQEIPGCLTGTCTEVREDTTSKQFLGGCDLREELENGNGLKSIDDFNKKQEGKDPVLDRLKNVLKEIDVDVELFDQVVEGMKNEGKDLDEIAAVLGVKIKGVLKEIAVSQLRIS